MTPLEAMDRAILASVVMSHDRKRPGAVVMRLSPEVRKALVGLTSDELGKLRVELGGSGHRSQRWKR